MAAMGSSQPSDSNSIRGSSVSRTTAGTSSSSSGISGGGTSSADNSISDDASSIDSNTTASNGRNGTQSSVPIATNGVVVASDPNDPLQKAEVLRSVGKTYLSSKQYSKAALCYSAVLQVVEGVGGVESGEIRQRCSLTLAECEIKLGNLYSAIARCSEVIDECPDLPVLDAASIASDTTGSDVESTSTSRQQVPTADMEKLTKCLSQARYRRGIALFRLEEPELALLDLQEALRMVPGDERIQERIETIESVLMNAASTSATGATTVSTSTTTTTSTSTSTSTSVPTSTSTSALQQTQQDTEVDSISSPIDDLQRVHEERREQLLGIVEDSLVNYPRVTLSKKQITEIVRTRRIGGSSSSQRTVRTTNIMATAKGSGGLGGLGGMMDMLGAGGGAGGGGLGNIGSMLGSLMGSGASGDGSPLGAIGPMLQMFGGVDAATVKNIGEMWSAVRDVFTLFKKGFHAIQNHKGQIALVLTLVWVALSMWPYAPPGWGLGGRPKGKPPS
jgi:tetratricopeptide (TPR) repeat protein